MFDSFFFLVIVTFCFWRRGSILRLLFRVRYIFLGDGDGVGNLLGERDDFRGDAVCSLFELSWSVEVTSKCILRLHGDGIIGGVIMRTILNGDVCCGICGVVRLGNDDVEVDCCCWEVANGVRTCCNWCHHLEHLIWTFNIMWTWSWWCYLGNFLFLLSICNEQLIAFMNN